MARAASSRPADGERVQPEPGLVEHHVAQQRDHDSEHDRHVDLADLAAAEPDEHIVLDRYGVAVADDEGDAAQIGERGERDDEGGKAQPHEERR